MTTPGGALMWGQAGSYAAPDDRMVITALARGQTGLAKPLALTAGTGLNVLLGAGWLAIADCGDTTLAAIGSRVQQTVAANPAIRAHRGTMCCGPTSTRRPALTRW